VKKGQMLRSRAKAEAVDLLIVHGFNGFSFNLLADRVGTTSANLHYHFKNKMTLVEDVIDDYANDTAAWFGSIWLDEGADFASKVRATYRFNKRRYGRFNNARRNGRPWSLIARMRTDQEALSEAAVNYLQAFSKSLADDVRRGVEMCVDRGVLRADTPVDAVALQVTSIINSAGPITQDAGNIKSLEKLYEAFLSTVLEAYGTE